MAAAAAVVASFSLCNYSSIRDIRISAARKSAIEEARALGTPFLSNSPLRITNLRNGGGRGTATRGAVSITRCEQSSEGGGNGVEVWVSRLAMVGFAAAISVEIATGKGLLENFGLTAPLPTVALAVTALVGVLTAVFIFQSASKN